nr:MAG TPA: ABC transporter, substrate-binding protein transporter [Caudoviricetes sp.]
MCRKKWLAAMTMPWLIGSSLTGCGSLPPRTGIEYCDHARPVYFNSAAEVDATPAAIRRQVLEHNEMVSRLCF